MHTAKKQYEMDMCSGSILKKMLLFTLPLMLSSILQLLFNAADIVVVGKFAGDNALAAVGSNRPRSRPFSPAWPANFWVKIWPSQVCPRGGAATRARAKT